MLHPTSFTIYRETSPDEWATMKVTIEVSGPMDNHRVYELLGQSTINEFKVCMQQWLAPTAEDIAERLRVAEEIRLEYGQSVLDQHVLSRL